MNHQKNLKDGENVVMQKIKEKMPKLTKMLFVCLFVFLFAIFFASQAQAVEIDPIAPILDVDDVVGVAQEILAEGVSGSATLNILFLSVLIILLPSILVVMTSFTRLIIVFSFLRSGMGTNQMPPNTVLIGLALMLTMFFMNDTLTEINENAIAPLAAGQITTGEAIDYTMVALRYYMMRQDSAGSNSLGNNVLFFAGISGTEIEHAEDNGIIFESIPNYILIPAFILHELTLAFAFGVFIFIPFIIIDMVVASVLMAMGMMMLPPAMISLPFKIMLFVLVDGWALVINTLARTLN